VHQKLQHLFRFLVLNENDCTFARGKDCKMLSVCRNVRFKTIKAMKKLLLIAFAVIALTITSCSYFSNHSTGVGKSSGNTKDDYPPELIEMVNQYHLNIDTTKTYNLDIKVFQTIGDNECLANERSDSRFNWYNGQLIYYMTSDLIYDDKIIKEKAYLLGTYRYKTVDTIRQYKVVPFYCETHYFESLKEDGFFDFIQEIQDN
jgi:hypothetical protein